MPQEGETAVVVFVADDLAAWLIFISAEGGRKKLTSLILGDDQKRALRPAATEAVRLTAAELCPGDAKRAEELAIMIGQLFRTPVPGAPLGEQGTVLEALQVRIAEQLRLLDCPGLTVTLKSLTGMRDVSATVVAQKLTGHLVTEIVVRGSRGGSLFPLASQLNDDVTHLQGQRLAGMLAHVVTLVTELVQAGRGPAVPRKPVRLAPRPVLLAGREELLADLDTMLTGGGGTGPGIVALCGLGGAGKTSVAVEYAHRHLGEVGVAWQFAAEDPTVLAAGFGELAAQLETQDPADTQDPVASVHAVLAASPEDWPLIFDNVPDRAAVARFLPPTGRGRVLVTSRNADWPPGQVLDVPVLDTEAAAGFLVTRTGDHDEQTATEVAAELGGLPLALEQAGAYVQASGGSLAGYLASFRQRRPEMLARGETGEYGKTVATTWSLAFTELKRSAPQAVGLLRLLASCAPEPVPVRLLLQPRPGLAEEFAEEVAPVLVPLLGDELAAGDAVAALRRYSLVTPAGDGLVLMHRLVQAVTAEQMSEALREGWRAAAAALVEATIPGDPYQPGTWRDFDVLLPHAQAVLDLTSRGMLQIANYLGYSGSYPAARDVLQLIDDARTVDDAYGAEHAGTLAARASLASFTGAAGDAAGARDQFAALLPIRVRVLGPEHPDTLTARHELALFTGAAGDAAGARDQFAALLPIRVRVLGPEHSATLTTRANLASFSGQAGDAAGARDQFAALLPIRARVSGAEHTDTLTTRHNLAAWTGQAGDAAGARDQFAALLLIVERVLGPEHPATLTTRASLASSTGTAGDAAGARDQLAALLPIVERVLGPEHPATLATHYDLAHWTREADRGRN
jgi:Tetratricopeptide repeat